MKLTNYDAGRNAFAAMARAGAKALGLPVPRCVQLPARKCHGCDKRTPVYTLHVGFYELDLCARCWERLISLELEDKGALS